MTFPPLTPCASLDCPNELPHEAMKTRDGDLVCPSCVKNWYKRTERCEGCLCLFYPMDVFEEMCRWCLAQGESDE